MNFEVFQPSADIKAMKAEVQMKFEHLKMTKTITTIVDGTSYTLEIPGIDSGDFDNYWMKEYCIEEDDNKSQESSFNYHPDIRRFLIYINMFDTWTKKEAKLYSELLYRLEVYETYVADLILHKAYGDEW
jgi:hypothetical protein